MRRLALVTAAARARPQDLAAMGGLPALMTAGRWKSSRMPMRYTERQADRRGAVPGIARKYGRSPQLGLILEFLSKDRPGC